MYDNIKLPHDNPITGEREKFFQTKCGPQMFRSMTPKELLDYSGDYKDMVSFYDYYYDYKDDGSFDLYYDEYRYDATDKVWLRTLTCKRVRPRSLKEGGPEFSNERTLVFEKIEIP